MKIPQYPAFKPSGVDWLGEIPEHWDTLSNKYIFKLKKSQVGKKSGDYVLLSLTLNGVIKRDMVNPQGKFPAEFDTYQEVKKGDFIFCLFDVEETPRTVGLSDYDGMITGAYTVMQPNDNFDKSFLYYFYLNLDSDKRMKPLYAGLRNTISKENFFSFRVFVPPLPEQSAIASFLDRKTAQIDQAIAQKERMIELLKERRQILIHNAVTLGLNPDVKMKNSGVEWIGEIPEHWEVKRLKYISSVQSGITLGKTYTNNSLKSFPYLRVANVQSGYFKLEEIAYISIPERDAEKYYVRKGDILVTEGGDLDKLGRGAVWNNEIVDCLHQNHIFAIRIECLSISPVYISLLMESDYGRKYFTNTANKTTNLASTNSTKLGNFPLILPPEPERDFIMETIYTFGNKIATAISLKEQEIEKLKEYKATLINSTVTGKIKVC